ncbi:ie1 [Oxyplax ochracea nucleopolyhedrovirus]|uniref:Ie1 n=1 Tax=Oxyplax ochracea nucleopolyhedrovirus TaxID=2083176 RepID=A0A2L0WTX6_9ABAC|nr:ie1 [Oxyplax ochracea nucleopolyhedrovirus]AVA31105.1 ie1 [Oxyplax ochracea nucleopolyhedrovirus]
MKQQNFTFNVAYNSPSTPLRVNYQQNFEHVDLYKNTVRPNCDGDDNLQKTNMEEVIVDNILFEADKLHTNINEELQFVTEVLPELISDDAAVDSHFLEDVMPFSESSYLIPSNTISNSNFYNKSSLQQPPQSPQNFELNTPRPELPEAASAAERPISTPSQVELFESISQPAASQLEPLQLTKKVFKRKSIDVDVIKSPLPTIFKRKKYEEETNEDISANKEVDTEKQNYSEETANKEVDTEKQNYSEETDDGDSDRLNDKKKLYSFKRTLLRSKYKKNKIVNSVVVSDNNTANTLQTLAEEKISKFFREEFTPYLKKFNYNETDKFISNKRFCDHMAETSFYTFLIKKNEYNEHKYDVTYMTYTKNVCKEYANKYYLIDNRVFVVTIERCRFMVSYNLVKFFNIEIPEFQDMQEINDPKRCSFIDTVGTFKTLLIAAFELNMYYLQTTLVAKFIALGELRSSHILRKFNEMFQDSSMFTLPFVDRNDNNSESDNCELITPQNQRLSVSPYVMQIIKISKNLKYPQCSFNEFAINNLKKVVIENYSGGSLTYKYASVANLLYTNYKYNSKVLNDKNFNDNVYKNEFKSIKKEDGSLLMIDHYLFQNADNENGHNFILATFKNEDRLTIIKKNELFYWIYLELQDNNAKEKINKFNKFLHHTFVISKANRRDSCVIHNHLIKLIALVVQNLIPLSDAIEFAQKQLNCKHNIILST